MQNCLIADSLSLAATAHSRQLQVDCRQSPHSLPPHSAPVKGAKAEAETWPMTRRRHNNNNNLVTVHYSIRTISGGTTKTAETAAATVRQKTHYSLSFSLNSPRCDSRQFASLLFRFVSLLFRAFDIKVFTVFRLEFEARKRSAVSKVLPSTINQHTHAHHIAIITVTIISNMLVPVCVHY